MMVNSHWSPINHTGTEGGWIPTKEKSVLVLSYKNWELTHNTGDWSNLNMLSQDLEVKNWHGDITTNESDPQRFINKKWDFNQNDDSRNQMREIQWYTFGRKGIQYTESTEPKGYPFAQLQMLETNITISTGNKSKSQQQKWWFEQQACRIFIAKKRVSPTTNKDLAIFIKGRKSTNPSL